MFNILKHKGAPETARRKLTSAREAADGYAFRLSVPLNIAGRRVERLYIRAPQNAGDMELLMNVQSAAAGNLGTACMELLARLSGAPLDELREQVSSDDFAAIVELMAARENTDDEAEASE